MISIKCADCLDYLKHLKDDHFDAIITDPPYNVSNKTKITRNGGKYGIAKDINLDFGAWDHNVVMYADFIGEFARILKPNGVLAMFYNKLWIGEIARFLEDSYGFQTRHVGAWVKSNPAPQARKVKWQNGSEFFLVSTKNKGSGHHFNYKLGQSKDWMSHSVSYKHHHPTQKPLPIMEWIVNYWTFEGDLILDPFMGSGTTGRAAARLKRNFLGFEKDPAIYETARELLEEEARLSDFTIFFQADSSETNILQKTDADENQII